MTHQEERNKRFDEKFGNAIDADNSYVGDVKNMKSHITSEVQLAIEQVEKWAEKYLETKDEHVEPNEVDIVIDDLLSFLTTLKK